MTAYASIVDYCGTAYLLVEVLPRSLRFCQESELQISHKTGVDALVSFDTITYCRETQVLNSLLRN
jgi:hypothetical protein